MRRRDFIVGLGSGATCALVARAQQPVLPVIGYLTAGGPENDRLVAAPPFMQGLREAGYVEGQNVVIERRHAEGRYDRLPELAAALVRNRASVIVATPNTNAARAAMAATATIPILFMVGSDPTLLGLVASLNRPGGNATGVNYFLTELTAKRLQVLHRLLPAAKRFGALINPASGSAEDNKNETIAAAAAVGVQIEFGQARDTGEIEAAFKTFAGNRIDALLVLPDTFFANQRVRIAALAESFAVPTMYTVREYVEVGGLVSYGPDLRESYHQLGVYSGRILKGAKPADLPVVQSTKIEFVINLKTAKVLGIDVPPQLLALTDSVID